MFHHLASPLTCWVFLFESGFTVPLSEWAFPWRTWCSCCCVEARSEGSERRPHWQWPPEGQDLHRETPGPRKSEKQAISFHDRKAASKTGHNISFHDRKAASPWTHENLKKQATASVFLWQQTMKIWKTGHSISFHVWPQCSITPDPWKS